MDCLYRINHIKLVLFSDGVLIFYVAFSIDRDCVFQSSNDYEKKFQWITEKKRKAESTEKSAKTM